MTAYRANKYFRQYTGKFMNWQLIEAACLQGNKYPDQLLFWHVKISFSLQSQDSSFSHTHLYKEIKKIHRR